MSAKQYRKKTPVVEARQLTNDPTQAQELATWSGGHWSPDSNPDGSDEMQFIIFRTVLGRTLTYPGDWIIKDENGRFAPIRKDIFEKTYEPAPAASDGATGAEGDAR